jgi:hypothetical protein
MRLSETISNNEYVPRLHELAAQGAGYFAVKVLHGGYEIIYLSPKEPEKPESPRQMSMPNM